jgi:hypothetical protein
MKNVIRLTDTILWANYDSVYLDNLPDESNFTILLTSRVKTQQIYATGNAPEKLDSLVGLFTKLYRKNDFKRVDTSFAFKSSVKSLSDSLKYEGVYEKSSTKKFDPFEYGQAIIDNKIQPADNDETFACLDSIHSYHRFKTRQFFFKVYTVIAAKSDAALSEVIGGHLKDYLFHFPNECLTNYSTLGKAQKIAFIDFLAFEFYASPGNIKKRFSNTLITYKEVVFI